MHTYTHANMNTHTYGTRARCTVQGTSSACALAQVTHAWPETTTNTYNSNITWHATLPATPASIATSYNITAHSASSGATVTLKDVVFGDV